MELLISLLILSFLDDLLSHVPHYRQLAVNRPVDIYTVQSTQPSSILLR